MLHESENVVKGALAQRYNTFRGQNGLRLYMPPLPPHAPAAGTRADRSRHRLQGSCPVGIPTPQPPPFSRPCGYCFADAALVVLPSTQVLAALRTVTARGGARSSDVQADGFERYTQGDRLGCRTWATS